MSFKKFFSTLTSIFTCTYRDDESLKNNKKKACEVGNKENPERTMTEAETRRLLIEADAPHEFFPLLDVLPIS